MAKESESAPDLFVDECYFSLLFNDQEEQQEEETFTVSDDKYAEGLQFQEALMASTINASSSQNPNQDSLSFCQISFSRKENDQDPIETTILEPGQSSFSFCEICDERKQSDQMFKIDSCVHSYCSDCISKHVAAKIQDRVTIFTCPGLNCKAVLELDTCRPVLPKGVLDQWEDALCEELIGPSQKFYCPFRDCSGMLVNDNEGEIIRESECPFCHRLFCAQCYVPWHPGVECEEYQRLNEDERGRDDLMVRELAKEKQWSRCPKCKFYVERIEGCPHMICRCQFQFCYGCDSEWTPSHGGCQKRRRE